MRAGDRHDPVRVFRFMSANQAAFPIAAMARALGVSEAGLAGVSRRNGTRTTGREPQARPTRHPMGRIKTIPTPLHPCSAAGGSGSGRSVACVTGPATRPHAPAREGPHRPAPAGQCARQRRQNGPLA